MAVDRGLGLSSSASRIEAAFERVNATLAAQQEQIRTLQADIARCPSIDEFESLRGAVSTSLRALESRVTAIETATRLPSAADAATYWTPTTDYVTDLAIPDTAAEALIHLAQRVGAVEAISTTLATHESLSTQLRDLKQHADIQIAAVEDDKATKTAMSALESAVVASRRRCDAFDVALARKADVSVLAEIEAAAATVEQERDSIQQLREAQELATTKITALEDGLHAEVGRGEDILTVLESVSTQLASKATQADMEAELASVRLALEAAKSALQDSINQIETHQDTDETQMDELNQKLEDHQAKLDAHQTELNSLGADIDARPVRDDCWPRERGEAIELGVTRLRDALRSRASSEAVTAAQSTLDGVKRQLSVAESRIAVALEFVEWYAAKGAGLEHNTRVVDDHLRKLATEGVSQAAARQAAAAATA